ncbi:MAG: ATP-binding cassette domain-containing protein, partial [Pseudomonadota bacterium]|nr:ATP-binding cassette domain-containing protein [Pseudomonadota bacterium]
MISRGYAITISPPRPTPKRTGRVAVFTVASRHPKLAAVLPGATPLLDISGLTVRFNTDRGPFTAVSGLDLACGDGETVAVVGESGSGKSVTALAITRLIDNAGGYIAGGSIRFRDRAGTVHD